MPLAVRQEVSRQLQKMQDEGIIQPSNSPWASPIVMVRKRDGSHRFCVDYRELNSVTKLDTYPLPRVDDLLDQLGESRFFSTLDLASGYWQIRVALGSREKTAFVVPNGFYEFRVMPFGLSNAPAVFQRLMQRVLMGLNPQGGQAFVSVYIDDILSLFTNTRGTSHSSAPGAGENSEGRVEVKASQMCINSQGSRIFRAHTHPRGFENQPQDCNLSDGISNSN